LPRLRQCGALGCGKWFYASASAKKEFCNDVCRSKSFAEKTPTMLRSAPEKRVKTVRTTPNTHHPRKEMPMAKRGNGEGSIYRLSDGRWRAAVVTGKDANGKLLRKTFTRATKHEVAEALNKAIHDQGRGINIAPEKRTLGHFLDSWLAGAKCDKAPSSYVCYENVVRIHIKPRLGRYCWRSYARNTSRSSRRRSWRIS
jgi:hypothetical protein